MPIDWIHQACPKPDETSRSAAIIRQASLTKPAGSLGRLENIATDFAAWQSLEIPALEQITIRIFAGDHGVCDQGVSAFPQAVTAQMVQNFISGGAAISVLAKHLNANFKVVNMGTVMPIDSHTDSTVYTNAQIAPRTADFSQSPAMTEQELEQALSIGRAEVDNCDLFIGGEMGIGNTTAASAIYAALLKLTAKQTVGPGTGIDSNTQSHKAAIIDSALALHKDQLNSPLAVLKHLGGFEVAALVGAYIRAAQTKTPILIDGFICTSAALIACKINKGVRDWMLFSHKSAEPAHMIALKTLNAEPLLDLQMRLGEGSGAAVAVPLLKNALALHGEMATFAAAGVNNKGDTSDKGDRIDKSD